MVLGIDHIELIVRDVDEFVNCVRFLGASFGGIRKRGGFQSAG